MTTNKKQPRTTTIHPETGGLISATPTSRPHTLCIAIARNWQTANVVLNQHEIRALIETLTAALVFRVAWGEGRVLNQDEIRALIETLTAELTTK